MTEQTEKSREEIRYEWAIWEDETRQTRLYTLQKLSIYSGFAWGSELEEFLKVVLTPDILGRNVPFEKIETFQASLNENKPNRIFADLVEPLNIFRPYEIALFREAIGGKALHEAFVALEHYYEWASANSPSAYSTFYYRLSLLIQAGVSPFHAIRVLGEKDRILHDLVEELSKFNYAGITLTDFFRDAQFPEWMNLVIAKAERENRQAEALQKLATYSTKAFF